MVAESATSPLEAGMEREFIHQLAIEVSNREELRSHDTTSSCAPTEIRCRA